MSDPPARLKPRNKEKEKAMINPDSPAMVKASERFARIVKAREIRLNGGNHEESLREFEDANA